MNKPEKIDLKIEKSRILLNPVSQLTPVILKKGAKD
jgi:hypothetical protein